MKKETLALLLLSILILAAVLIPVGARWLMTRSQPAVIDLRARMPENGGWSIPNIQAVAGQPLTLRIISDDVVHGFAVGKSNIPAVDLLPGEVVVTTLTFEKPGKYTFYCTRWCGPNHWRMRGTIDVVAAGSAQVEPLTLDPQPLYLRLGIDPDAPHRADVTPASPPSAIRGGQYAPLLPANAVERDNYLASSPADLWKALRSEKELENVSDSSLWDIVAWVWAQQTSPAALAAGKALYAENCAACHGETGRGDGVIVRDLPVWKPGEHSDSSSGHEVGAEGLVRPPDFTDPENLLGASPALLEGKIIRGGMGTGMPYWGPILTPDNIDALISYLYTFALGPLDEAPLDNE